MRPDDDDIQAIVQANAFQLLDSNGTELATLGSIVDTYSGVVTAPALLLRHLDPTAYTDSALWWTTNAPPTGTARNNQLTTLRGAKPTGYTAQGPMLQLQGRKDNGQTSAYVGAFGNESPASQAYLQTRRTNADTPDYDLGAYPPGGVINSRVRGQTNALATGSGQQASTVVLAQGQGSVANLSLVGTQNAGGSIVSLTADQITVSGPTSVSLQSTGGDVALGAANVRLNPTTGISLNGRTVYMLVGEAQSQLSANINSSTAGAGSLLAINLPSSVAGDLLIVEVVFNVERQAVTNVNDAMLCTIQCANGTATGPTIMGLVRLLTSPTNGQVKARQAFTVNTTSNAQVSATIQSNMVNGDYSVISTFSFLNVQAFAKR